MDDCIVQKAYAWHAFWSGFGIPAYDENSVPDDAHYPYITYEMEDAEFDESVVLNVSLWYRSSFWTEITQKAQEIANAIPYGGKIIPVEGGGFIWLKRGIPFYERMRDETDDMIRQIYFNIDVNFLTR